MNGSSKRYYELIAGPPVHYPDGRRYRRKAKDVAKPVQFIVGDGIVMCQIITERGDAEVDEALAQTYEWGQVFGLEDDVYLNWLGARLDYALRSLSPDIQSLFARGLFNELRCFENDLTADRLVAIMQSTFKAARAHPAQAERFYSAYEYPSDPPAQWYLTWKADKRWTPSVFLKAVWGSYVELGLLAQVDLQSLDPGLLRALQSELERSPDILNGMISVRKGTATRRLEAAAGRSLTMRERIAAEVAKREDEVGLGSAL